MNTIDLPKSFLHEFPAQGTCPPNHSVFENQINPPKRQMGPGEGCQQTDHSKSSVATQSLPLDRKIWLTLRDAADYLGTTPGGLRNRVYRGQLKPHKPFGFFGRCYFKRTDLDRLFENS